MSGAVREFDREAVAIKIIEHVALGGTLKEICQGSDMPHVNTFKKWLVDDPRLKRAYEAARAVSAEALEEEALMAARELKRSPGDAQRVGAFRALMDQLRWSASRRDPGRFGDRGPVTVRVPIQIITPLMLGDPDAQQAAPTVEGNIYQLTAKVTTPVDAEFKEIPAPEEPPKNERLLRRTSSKPKRPGGPPPRPVPFSKIARGEVNDVPDKGS